MSVTVTWLPNIETDMASYDLQRAPDDAGVPGVWVDLVNIPHNLSGPNYDPQSNRFFYDDTTGTLTHWYRIRAVDTAANKSPYGNPFQPSESVQPPPFANTTALNEDYDTPNALQYTDPDGNPVKDAQIRVYKKLDYDLENFGAALGVAKTEDEGNWSNPITVEAGFTYTIQFFKPGELGPDAIEVIVP